MRFIHIADIHLGVEPNGLKEGNKERGREIWHTFEEIIYLCEEEKQDLLLIAGDLFHRQPLMRELKEVNFLFSKLTKTKVVLIAGNHDYLKPDSYYHTFKWNENVHFLVGKEMEIVEFPELKTAVYGFSYYHKEITEKLYDGACALGKQKYEILLAHGGDEKHIPVQKELLNKSQYDYIAMGHIHKPQAILENRGIYPGALEPTDINDTGVHGYVCGEITEKGLKTEFVPFAKREYKHLQVAVSEETTSGALKELLRDIIAAHGSEHMYKFILTGFRDPDIQFEIQEMMSLGNVFQIVDETALAYDFLKIAEQNEGNLLGRYIESLQGFDRESIEYQALYLGVQALTETKRG